MVSCLGDPSILKLEAVGYSETSDYLLLYGIAAAVRIVNPECSGLMLGLPFDPKVGGGMLLRNVGLPPVIQYCNPLLPL
jgi:hypothetical protein